MARAIMHPDQRQEYTRRMVEEDARRRRQEQDQRNRESDMRAYRERKDKQIAAAANAPVSGDSVSYGTEGPKGIGRLAAPAMQPDKFPPSNVPSRVGWGFRTDANGNSIEPGGVRYQVPANSAAVQPVAPPRALQPGGKIVALPPNTKPLTPEERWPGGPPSKGPARPPFSGGRRPISGDALENPHKPPVPGRPMPLVARLPAAGVGSSGGRMPRVTPHNYIFR